MTTYLFFTGGYDSTYRLCELAIIKKRVVQPIYISDPFIDNYKTIKRLAQIISLKDIGSIIANTGIHRDSIVMESGTGSAGLSCFLAHICKKVISYDINDKHTDIAKANIKNLGVKNIELKKGNVYDDKQIKEMNHLMLLQIVVFD